MQGPPEHGGLFHAVQIFRTGKEQNVDPNCEVSIDDDVGREHVYGRLVPEPQQREHISGSPGEE